MLRCCICLLVAVGTRSGENNCTSAFERQRATKNSPTASFILCFFFLSFAIQNDCREIEASTIPPRKAVVKTVKKEEKERQRSQKQQQRRHRPFQTYNKFLAFRRPAHQFKLTSQQKLFPLLWLCSGEKK